MTCRVKYVSSTRKALNWKLTRKGKVYRHGRVKLSNDKAGIHIPRLSKLKRGRYVLKVGGRFGSRSVIRVR